MLNDLMFAARLGIKRPLFSLLVILTLATGIGTTSAVFSLVNSILLQPLPYHRADTLVYGFGAFSGGNRVSISPADFRDYRARSRAFSSLAAHTPFGVSVLSDGEPERVSAPFVTANLFATLGVRPLLGRAFLPEEEEGGPHLVVMLSHSLWQRRFGGDPAVVGRDTTLDGSRYRIVGVMPPVVERTLPNQLWRPFAFNLPETSGRRFRVLRVIGRLREDVTLQTAQGDLDRIATQLASTHRENESWRLRLVPYQDVIVGAAGPALLYLLGAVGLVLLIACANVANLMLVRATSRESEMALRTALGASRTRIIRQLLTENHLLAGTAGIVGLLLALLLVRATRSLGVGVIPRAAEVHVDGTAVLFTVIVTLTTALLFGLAPAVRAARSDLMTSVTGSARSSGTRRMIRARDALVVAQVALSLVLLIGAGLLLRSMWLLQRVELGFVPQQLLTAQVTLPLDKYPSRVEVEQFWSQFLSRLRALPGVEAAAGATSIPLGEASDARYHVEGRSSPSDAQHGTAQVNVVMDDYFEAMRIPLVAGRPLGPVDRRPTAQADDQLREGTVVVSRGLEERLFPHGGAVGKRLVVELGKPFVAEIVGVAADVHALGPQFEVPDIIYFSQRQISGNFDGRVMSLVVRTHAAPGALVPAVRGVLLELEPTVPLAGAATMEQVMRASMADASMRMQSLLIAALMSLFLAVMGLYGVLAYSVTQRTREIGVRLALGARQTEIFRMVVLKGMLLVALGAGTGVAISLIASRVMTRLLFGITSTDPVVYAGVTGTLLATGLVACALPAWRATRINPTAALREAKE